MNTIIYIVGGVVLVAAVIAVLIVLVRRRSNRQRPGFTGTPPVYGGPNGGPPPTSGPIPVANPAGPPDYWHGSSPSAPSADQTGPMQVGATDDPTTGPTATAPGAFGTGTERVGGSVKTPADEAAKIDQLKSIAALRDSGALTDAEFEAEKHKILDGD